MSTLKALLVDTPWPGYTLQRADDRKKHTLHVYSAGGGKRIHNHIHTVDVGNLYTLIFTMQVVARKTPPRPYC